MRLYESVVSDDLLEHFSNWSGRRALGTTLLTYVANEGTLQGAIACAALFWPAIVEDGDLVIMANFYYPDTLPELRERFGNDKSRIERWYNARTLADFFTIQQSGDDPIVEDATVLGALGQALQLFWTLRLQALFPTRQFIVEVGDDLEGDVGLAITFYEVPITDQN